MCAKQIIISITIDEVCRFAVYGYILCFIAVNACSRLRVKLYDTDIPEVSTIGEPEPSRSGIKEKSCIYGVIIFVAIG